MNKNLVCCLCLLLIAAFSTGATDARLLWQIGKPDHNNAEFALAPGGYEQFKNDALFIAGKYDPKQDWPYVQPGPDDAWADGHQHTR